MKKRFFAIISCMIVVTLLFTGCGTGKNYEKQLEGSWYLEGKDSPAFTLYSDGTCEIDNEYGTGKWAIVNDDQLKLTSFYGETMVVTIVSIENGCFTFDTGSDGLGELWDSPQ